MTYKKAGKVNVRKHPRIVKRKIIPVRQHKRSYPESTPKRQQNSKINIKPTIGRKVTHTPEINPELPHPFSIALPEEKVKELSKRKPYVKSEKQKYKEIMKEIEKEIDDEISKDVNEETKDINEELKELDDELEDLDEELEYIDNEIREAY